MQMGCFGLGMTRILAGVVEASHDTDVRMAHVACTARGERVGTQRSRSGAHQTILSAQGIIWPSAIAPYRLCIVVAASPKDAAYAQLTQAAERLYDELGASCAPLRGEIILDDRNATTTFGYRLKDALLVGYPYLAVLGRSFLQNGAVELHTRYWPRFTQYVETTKDLT